jgi:hypothetical protein
MGSGEFMMRILTSQSTISGRSPILKKPTDLRSMATLSQEKIIVGYDASGPIGIESFLIPLNIFKISERFCLTNSESDPLSGSE